MSLLKTTSEEHFCTLIDGSDAFNVRWANASQVDWNMCYGCAAKSARLISHCWAALIRR